MVLWRFAQKSGRLVGPVPPLGVIFNRLPTTRQIEVPIPPWRVQVPKFRFLSDWIFSSAVGQTHRVQRHSTAFWHLYTAEFHVLNPLIKCLAYGLAGALIGLPMTRHEHAESLVAQFRSRELTEADTRHQILDPLLHDVLSWPRDCVKCEEHVHPGYIDYVLRDKADRAVLLIEAKREGRYFHLPTKPKDNTLTIRYIRLRTLATDGNITAAVQQAAQYCPAIGCQYACVTNGHEFIIFRSFIPGKHFLDADALVISDLSFFSEKFIEAYNLLAFQAVTSDRSLQSAFGFGKAVGRELYYPKNGITHYDAAVQKNQHAKFLEPIARKYFGEIASTDKRMMDHCYVFARGTRQVEEGMKTRLTDDLTAYFQADGAQNISDVRTGGKLGQRIAQSLQKKLGGEVLILYGGKGAGKSTFLRRLLYHDAPIELVLHGFPIIIDCIRAPQSKEELTRYIWDLLTTGLDQNNLLDGSMEGLLQLFEDKFEVAKKQELAGYGMGSGGFIRARNALAVKWKEDRIYVAKRLKNYWLQNGKKLVVAFDNTDQLPPVLQDHCFLLAQSISRDLECVGIISMREERYCRARTVGVLDAYQNAGYHLAAPELAGVFTKRIRMVIRDLGHKNILEILPEDAPFEDLKRFFVACLRQFRDEQNALRRFLEECSRDNTRLALQFFCQFVSSGYTHIEEMISNAHWTVISHQVIKPMMIPQRFSYDENKSLIPNLYQCRTPQHGSHFTTIRILRTIRYGVGMSPGSEGYWRVDALIDEFDSKFGMRQDCESALDVVLRHGLVEANNRLDSYFVEKAGTDGHELIYADEIRITAFGIYMLEYLSRTFTYLELVSLDCGLADESLYHSFCKAAAAERIAGTSEERRARMMSRMERASAFVRYLQADEDREKSEFLLNDADGIMPSVAAAFEEDKGRALASAAKNIRRGIKYSEEKSREIIT